MAGAVPLALFRSDASDGHNQNATSVTARSIVVGITGLSSLTNLVVGYFATAHRPQERRDYLSASSQTPSQRSAGS